MAKAKVVLRKGRLSIEEKQFLDKNSDMEIEKLCKKLKRTKETIMGYLEVEEKVEPESEPKRESYVKELFSKKTDRSVMIMTEGASSYMDQQRKVRSGKNNLDQSFIHKFDKNK